MLNSSHFGLLMSAARKCYPVGDLRWMGQTSGVDISLIQRSWQIKQIPENSLFNLLTIPPMIFPNSKYRDIEVITLPSNNCTLAIPIFSDHILPSPATTTVNYYRIMAMFSYITLRGEEQPELSSASLSVSGDSEESSCPYLLFLCDKNPLTVLLTEIIMV